jgi:hypothetical protein
MNFPLWRARQNLPVQNAIKLFTVTMENTTTSQVKCQARLLLPEPKIFFIDGPQVFLTTMCGRALLDEKTNESRVICQRCGALPWGEAIHGLVTELPPAYSHCYGSAWFEEQLKSGSRLTIRDKLWLKACATTQQVHPLRLARLEEEAKPRRRVIIKSMPPRKAAAAQPPPPPSSPTHGSLPVPPSPAGFPQQEPVKKKRAKAVTKTATPSRKRSPTARIADRSSCSANAVAIGSDFERTQQRTEMLRSLLHVFEPAVFEEDEEPLEIDEYEYVKLHRDGSDDQLVNEADGSKYSYNIERGIIAL